MFLVEFGRKSFAVAIVGGGVVAACSSDGETSTAATATATTAPEIEATPEATDAPTATATEEPAPTEEAAAPAEEEATAPPVDLQWERVLLGNVSAYVLVRGNEAAVVDTGNPGSEPAISDALTTLGTDWAAVNHVVLTHLHGDHVGSLGAVMGSAQVATGYAGAADIDAIDSPRTLQAVGDGDDILGLQVIETPGHTEGSISVFDSGIGLLVAGDALNGGGGNVLPPNANFSANMTTATASIGKLAALPVRTAVFGHGDPVGAAEGELVDFSTAQ